MGGAAKRLIAAVGIYIAGVLAVVLTSYSLERERYLEDIDARLLAAASNLPTLLPHDFHDVARTKDAISPQQDRHNLERLTSHARSADMTYIYSYVMVDGKIHFTSCNYTQADIDNDRVVTYWTDYPEGDQKYFDAMTATEPIYVTASDRWGLFRTILMPLKSPGGLPYVAAADMDITVIDRALVDDFMAILGLALLLLFIVIPLIWVYHRTSSEMNIQLRQVNERLHNELRQARILEKELKQTSQQAEDASKIKSQFLSNMSHELRTPINGILGMNQLLQETQLDVEQREYIALSGHSAQILLDTVNQILDTAAIEANGLVLNPQATNIQQLLNEVSGMFSSQAALKKLDVVIHMDDNIPVMLNMDAVRVRQVFINLIANSLKFTREGGVCVRVGWQDGFLMAQIQDTGVGIPIDAQQEIFEIFNQVDNTHTREHSGSGLGLSIAQKICQIMDGQLRLLRSDEQGSVFSFELAAPALGDVKIERIQQPLTTRIGYWMQTSILQDWCAAELRDVNAIGLFSLSDAQQSMDDCHWLLVDADIGTDILQQLLEHKPDTCHVLALMRVGSSLSSLAAERVTIVRKPVNRQALEKALTQFV